MFDLAGLEHARAVVARAMPPTPQYRWPGLSRIVPHRRLRSGSSTRTTPATYAHELFSAVADLDVVYVPIGMDPASAD